MQQVKTKLSVLAHRHWRQSLAEAVCAVHSENDADVLDLCKLAGQ
jgi:hypothetical protein